MAGVEFHELDRLVMHYVYILASRPRGALYIGSTNDLGRRMLEHKEGIGSRHTARYGIVNLVWLEPHESAFAARGRERQIKRWHRPWKFALIEARNPDWRDLTDTLNE